MIRAAALALLCALPAAHAQPDVELAQVGVALIEGDSSRAYRIARDASRLDRESAGLAHARLRLEMSDHAETWLPIWMHLQQITDVANHLYGLNPRDTLALRALSTDALYTVLTPHDKVMSIDLLGGMSGAAVAGLPTQGTRPGVVSGGFGAGISTDVRSLMVDDVNRMLPTSKFDLGRRDMISFMQDATGQATSARSRLGSYLGRWKGVAPDDHRPHLIAATVAALDENWPTLLESARAFRSRRSDHPMPLLLLGLAHMRLGNVDAAEAAFEEGIARLPEPLRYRFSDIRNLLKPEQQDLYTVDPEGVAEAFWASSDPRLFTAANERRVEHYARVVEADLLFSLNLYDFPALFDLPLWPPSGAETEQGRIWIRYGRPEFTARFTSVWGETTYGEGDLRFAVWQYPLFRYVFADPWRRDSYQKYSPPATAFSGGDAGTATNDDYVIQDRNLQRETPTLTQVAPSFPLALLASRFRQPGGGTEVVVAYGVPVADPDRLPETFESGVFSVGGAGPVDVVRTTARPTRSRVLVADGGAVWANAATVALPTTGVVRAEVDAGDVWGAADASLAPLPASGFGLSDVLLASHIEEDGDGSVVRDGLAITPVPWGVFGVADPLYVYVEAYGLALDGGQSQYSVEVRLVPEAKRGGLLGRVFGRGQRPGVSVRNEAGGDRETEAVYVVLDTSAQEPGRYALQIEITDRLTGETSMAERAVLLE